MAGNADNPAALKLARTWEPRRPSRRSAIPNASFRCRPKRVAKSVSTNTVRTVRKPPIPAARQIANVTTDPASAPRAVTPRIPQATKPNARVIPSAGRDRQIEAGQPDGPAHIALTRLIVRVIPFKCGGTCSGAAHPNRMNLPGASAHRRPDRILYASIGLDRLSHLRLNFHARSPFLGRAWRTRFVPYASSERSLPGEATTLVPCGRRGHRAERHRERV